MSTIMKRQDISKLFQQPTEEAVLLKQVKNFLEAQRDIKYMRINDRYVRGYADVFACVNGWFCAFELKDNTGKPSQAQIDFLKDLKHAGGIGGICRSLGEVMYYVGQARCITAGCKRKNKS